MSIPGAQRVAIVTGAGSGIGRACARRLAAEGVRVLIADVNTEGLELTARMIGEAGGTSLSDAHDVADAAACARAAARAVDAWGRIDIVVANAGVQIGGSLVETAAADWARILDINLNGVAYTCKAAVPAMLRQGGGAIVIISSVNALVAAPGMAVYDMSKAGVLALARSLAAEYGQQGIRANAVCPGNTLTDFHIDRMAEQGMNPDQIRAATAGYGLLGRIAEPEEIANAVYFLASDQASFITGQALAVDGGYAIAGSA